MPSLEQQLEAILFWRGAPLATEELSKMCGHALPEIESALQALEQNLLNRGLRLIRANEAVALGTAPETSSLIERLTKEELSRDLGKAGLETLTIVLYRGPLTRAEIDYLRGVNSTFILRHLQIRDLVEKIPDPTDARRFLYRPTLKLLSYLGLTKVADLPEYETIVAKLKELNHDHH